jgi:hypothetical protein
MSPPGNSLSDCVLESLPTKKDAASVPPQIEISLVDSVSTFLNLGTEALTSLLVKF